MMIACNETLLHIDMRSRPKPQGAPSGVSNVCGRLRVDRDGRQYACKLGATWRVGLRLRSETYAEPFDYFFEQLKVCNCCRTKLTVQDVQTNNTFSHVSQKILNWHKPPPKRKLSRLVFQHLVMDFVAGGI